MVDFTIFYHSLLCQFLQKGPNMQVSEKLCLKWNDFQENLNSAFRLFRNDDEFADVTLACEDGTQVETHKVVLASSSPFFLEILKKNKNPHPLIYMRGVLAEDLVAMVDFLYFGEANVNQENLDSFLALAEEMRLKGLTRSAESSDRKYMPENAPKAKVARQNQNIESMRKPTEVTDVHHINAKEEPSFEMSVAIASSDVQQLDEQVKSMMGVSENRLKVGNQIKIARICKVCGKEGSRANIMTHIESNHMDTSDASHPCDICGKSSRSRNALRVHKAKDHRT